VSQLIQPLIAPARVRSRQAALLAAVLALAAAAVVVLVLTVDGSSTPAVPVGGKANPVHRSAGVSARDGVATAVSSRSLLPAGAGRPDESRVAVSITPPRAGGPDESRVAASIAGR
jgi:hypothetical protein